MRLGRAAEAAGDRDKAINAYRKVYYESPLSPQAIDAQNLLSHLDTASLADKFKLELARAERVFNARRWAQARAGFEPLASLASGDDKELVALRLAECDYYLDSFRASRDTLSPYLRSASRKAEARFFYLTATRALGDNEAYVEQAACARWRNFPTARGLQRRSIISRPTTSSSTTMRRRTRYSRSWSAAFRTAGTRSAPPGKSGGGRTRTAGLPTPRRPSTPAPPRSRAPIPGRRGSTGPARAHDQTGETAVANERYRAGGGRLRELLLRAAGLEAARCARRARRGRQRDRHVDIRKHAGADAPS